MSVILGKNYQILSGLVYKAFLGKHRKAVENNFKAYSSMSGKFKLKTLYTVKNILTKLKSGELKSSNCADKDRFSYTFK